MPLPLALIKALFARTVIQPFTVRFQPLRFRPNYATLRPTPGYTTLAINPIHRRWRVLTPKLSGLQMWAPVWWACRARPPPASPGAAVTAAAATLPKELAWLGCQGNLHLCFALFQLSDLDTQEGDALV